MLSITTLLGSRFQCSYGSWKKGRAIGVNDGQELVIFADTVSGAPWNEKYSWGGGGGDKLLAYFHEN